MRILMLDDELERVDLMASRSGLTITWARGVADLIA